MKKLYLIVLIFILFAAISAVSADENISDSQSVLEADDFEEVSAADENISDSQSVLEADDFEEVSAADENISDSQSVLEADDLEEVSAGDDNTSADSVQIPSKASAKNIKSTYGKKAKYSLKLYDESGNIIAGKEVKFKIGQKVYKVETNSKGVATLKLNYAAGKYKIKYSVDNLTGKNTYTVKNKVSMKILKWGNKGDISKLSWLKKNMPKNKWVKAAVKAAKKGNPLLKFKGGKGKKVFIIAGVHGNELSSQVAAMKLIKYLTKHPINGTVYVIPFVNIKAIAQKVRHTGVDYNRVAPKAGTISNKIVKLVVKYKCSSFGDLHTTQPGGLPGDNIVMGSKSPTAKSASLCNYIAKYAKVHKRIYSYAGQEYPTAFQDTLNKKGIPSVVCEVKLPHNTLTSKTIKTSLKMAKAILKFNSII